MTIPCKRWPCRPLSLHKFARRKSTIAFLTALPLILVVGVSGALPGVLFDALGDAEQSMTKFVGLGNVEECGGIGDHTVNFLPREECRQATCSA